ncbi:FAD binding domain-containing protein [Stagonosporopsis vannaccii]|nr:FAD binding domain-containing protein [Stagonosporopsis vannaccii]
MSILSRAASYMLVALFVTLVVAQTPSLSHIEPAAIHVPAYLVAGAPLQAAEALQLNDAVVARIATNNLTKEFANYVAFDNTTYSVELSDRYRNFTSCRTFPGDSEWPSNTTWSTFDALLGGALIPTIPIASPCYDSRWGQKDGEKCASILKNFTNPNFHESNPTSIMWPIFQGRTCMPSNNTSGEQCTIGGYPEYAINVTNVAQIQLAVNFARTLNMRLVIKNTGHCYLGKSSGAGALSLWMHNMGGIDFLPKYEGPGYSGPALKLAAGVTVREVYEAADKNNVTVTGAVSWSVGYAGGMITGGGQNPLAGIYGMAADHVIAFNVVTADGKFRTVSQLSNPDLFWALRGGGGGTFGVVVSVIIRVHPKLKVVTAGWRLDASINSVDAFWTGTKNFFDEFIAWADAGIYSFFIMGNTPTPFLNMMFLFAPNHTMESYTKIGANSFPIGLDNSLPANRIVPRANFQEKYNETFALIKEHVSSGKHFLGYHKAPANYGDIDNAVSPAWRNCAMFFVTSSNKSLDHSTPDGLAIANKDLQEKILQPWRDITPVSEGGGTYLNEASVMEPDWKHSFYGGYYDRLSEIKRKWDPNDVFYATTAVGSERWEVRDGDQGVQTQSGRLCRVQKL